MRAEKLVARFAELGIDAMLVASEANRRYLSAFTGTAGTLFVTGAERLLLTDFRYTQQAHEQAAAFEVVETREPIDAVIQRVAKSAPKRIGVEADHVPYAEYQRMAAKFAALPAKPELVPLEGVVERQRQIKDVVELEAIREAVAIADAVMAVAASAVRPGVSERSIATLLEFEMRKHGADEPAFPTIVAAGPNGAMAHHQPGAHTLQEGEPVIVDLGVKVRGYCSDVTRTFSAGAPYTRFRGLYRLVLEAQRAAEAALRSGLTGVDADALARRVIEEAGHGDRFGHGTGHGVGLQIHEAPRLSRRSTDTLKAGMVTSVEPGVYLPGWGGVRIEDLVLIREASVEVLTAAPK